MVGNRVDLNSEINVDAQQWRLGLAYGTTGDIAGGDDDVYLRLGEASTWESGLGELWGKDGWLDYTDGDHNSITKGNRYDYTDGAHVVKHGSSKYSYKLAATTSYSMTAENSHSLGLKTSSAAGLSVSSSFGANVTLKGGLDFNFSHGNSYSYTKGSSFSASDKFRQEVDKEISLAVDPSDSDWKEKAMEGVYPTAAAAIAASSAAIAAAIVIGGKYDGGETYNRLADVHGGLLAGLGAAMAGTTLLWSNPTAPDEPSAEFKMVKNSASLKVTGHRAGARKITLEAGKDFNDTKTAIIELKKDTVSEILIKAGEKGGVTIEADDHASSAILLKVGKSSIEITKESIVFKTGAETFTMDEATGLTIAKKGIEALKGEIKSKGGTISGKLETKDLDAKVMKATKKAVFG
jgi:hypothetical protein